MVTHKAWKKNLLIKYLRPRDFRRGEMEGNMFKKMRRFKQQLSQEKCIEILTNEPHGVLSLISDTGYPYGFPITHWYDEKNGHIYFHGAKEGHKIDAIKNNPKVSMSIIDQEDVIEEELTTYFRSVILFGKARILQEDDEIYHAIKTLGLKYNEDEVTVEKEIQREWKALCCIEITIEHISGKQAIELVNKNYQDLF